MRSSSSKLSRRTSSSKLTRICLATSSEKFRQLLNTCNKEGSSRNKCPIAAFFYPVNDTTCPGPDSVYKAQSCQQTAADAWLNFRKEYSNAKVPLLELNRTDMDTPFKKGKVKPNHVGQQLKVLMNPEYLVVFFPLAFVLFPIIITFISAVTAALEQGEFAKEFTGVYLMVSRFVPYYLYLPTMIAWYALCRARPVSANTNLTLSG